MADQRKAYISGRLTRDIELKTPTSDLTVCNFSIANKRRKGKTETEAQTDFFECEAYNQKATFLKDEFHQGDVVFLETESVCDSYEKEGQQHKTVKFKVVEVWFGPQKQNK